MLSTNYKMVEQKAFRKMVLFVIWVNYKPDSQQVWSGKLLQNQELRILTNYQQQLKHESRALWLTCLLFGFL